MDFFIERLRRVRLDTAVDKINRQCTAVAANGYPETAASIRSLLAKTADVEARRRHGKARCRHNDIEVVRAHPESPTGREVGHLSAWTDTLGVLNLLRCVRCGTYLKCRVTERMFGSANTTGQHSAAQGDHNVKA